MNHPINLTGKRSVFDHQFALFGKYVLAVPLFSAQFNFRVIGEEWSINDYVITFMRPCQLLSAVPAAVGCGRSGMGMPPYRKSGRHPWSI